MVSELAATARSASINLPQRHALRVGACCAWVEAMDGTCAGNVAGRLAAGRRALAPALLAALLLAATAGAGRANSLDNAQKFCAVLDATGVLAAKCAISSFSATLGLLIPAGAAQAKQFCDLVVAMAGENGLAFDPQWKVQVHSPASGNTPLAVCRFPRPAPTAESFGLRPQLEN